MHKGNVACIRASERMHVPAISQLWRRQIEAPEISITWIVDLPFINNCMITSTVSKALLLGAEVGTKDHDV
jgi:hypothetical protein